MYYEEFLPPAQLRAFIKCFWVLEAEHPPQQPAFDKVLPDGCMELIFHFGDPYKQLKGKTETIQPKAF